jgi:5-enolpyruvylshikimate-3-phosphate synthase
VQDRAGIKENNKKIVALKKSVKGVRISKNMTPDEKKAVKIAKLQAKLAELTTAEAARVTETAEVAQTVAPADKVVDDLNLEL